MVTQFYPLITVGIPTYNGGKFLSQAIQSVLGQTYHELEILVLDNCSTDDTASIVTEFQNRDSRIKYIRQPLNIGYINNYNSVTRHATGEFVLFFADDDIYDRDYIKLLWEEYDRDPGITISMGSVTLIDPGGKEIERINNFGQAKIGSTLTLKPVNRVSRIIRYGKNREWAWGIILGLHKKEVLLKHPFNSKLIDPGTLFFMSVIYEGDVAFNENAIFYKRTGGLSAEKNYGRQEETLKTKYADVKNQVLQSYYEFKAVVSVKFAIRDKLKLTSVFLWFRFPALVKRNFLFVLSFFSFLLVKKPYRFFKSILFERHRENI